MFMTPDPTGGAEVTEAGSVAGVITDAGIVAELSVLPSADSEGTPFGFGVCVGGCPVSVTISVVYFHSTMIAEASRDTARAMMEAL